MNLYVTPSFKFNGSTLVLLMTALYCRPALRSTLCNRWDLPGNEIQSPMVK